MPEPFTADEIIEIVLDGRFAMSRWISETIWLLNERYGARAIDRVRRLPEVPAPPAADAAIDEWTTRLQEIEKELEREDRQRERARLERDRLEFPWC